MPTKGNGSLMLLSGHYEIFSACAKSMGPIPVAPSRLITYLMVPKDRPVLRVSMTPSPLVAEAMDFATWLTDEKKHEEFGSITLPSWCLEELRLVVSANTRRIDGLFPRQKETAAGERPKLMKHTFTYRVGVWLLLAAETVQPGFLSNWMQSHKDYVRFARLARPRLAPPAPMQRQIEVEA